MPKRKFKKRKQTRKILGTSQGCPCEIRRAMGPGRVRSQGTSIFDLRSHIFDFGVSLDTPGRPPTPQNPVHQVFQGLCQCQSNSIKIFDGSSDRFFSPKWFPGSLSWALLWVSKMSISPETSCKNRGSAGSVIASNSSLVSESIFDRFWIPNWPQKPPQNRILNRRITQGFSHELEIG